MNKLIQQILDQTVQIEEKWTNLPSIDPVLHTQSTRITPLYMLRHYSLTTREIAQNKLQRQVDTPYLRPAWTDILLTQVVSAVESATIYGDEGGDCDELRNELVQCAAIIMAWINNIDSRSNK